MTCVQPCLKRRYVDYYDEDDQGLAVLLAACCLTQTFSRQNDDIHPKERASVQEQLIAFLNQCKPHAPHGMRQKLPTLARKLEIILFQAASTKEEYLDSSTFMMRLKAIGQLRQTKRRRVVPR
ncbi:hypothetical protein THRCLA_21926 [Thraustotheca clavata]|uniref:Uncharacterized protein n=1 Tax=Thraustotheca clavata TaxID=74557 RepID=A0A1V9ZHP2_9STRA|nr:hypothetical protein THRCLA_21926 [Thraustotheca clavata]